ncbi:MAG: NifB/NifX family molybdenum-iron cluster-binding protein [Candidatus Bathyarchaeota archaeon]
MTERIIIPTENQEGLNAKLAEHFGRAPYYTVVELGQNGEVINIKTVPNVGEHAGGMGFSHDHILEYKPTALIVYGMGPRGLNTFQSAGVAVLKANASTVSEVILAYKKGALPELTEGCEHAHHKDEHHEHEHHH